MILTSYKGKRGHLRDTIPILISSGASQGFIAVLYLLAARHVGPSAFGSALALIGVGNFISIMVDFGQNSFLLRELAASRITSQQVLQQVYAKNIVVACAAALFGLIVYINSSNIMLAGTLMIYVLLLSLEMTAQSILRWTGGAAKFSLSIFFDKAASLIVYLFVLAAHYTSPNWIPLALTVGSLVGLVMAVYLHPGSFRIKTQPFSVNQTVGYLVSARSFGFYGFAIALQGLDILALRVVAGPEATGEYAVVSRWIMPLILLASAYSQASYPHFAATKTHASAKALLKSGQKLWVASLFIIGGVILSAPLLVRSLLGPEYSNSIIVLRVLSMAMVFAILNQPLAVLLQARGKQNQVALSVGTGIVLQLLSTLTLGHYLSAVGGAYAWLLGQSIVFILLAINLRKLS